MTRTVWTPERDAELTRLVQDGLTYEAVAAALGVVGISRNSCIGRANRIGLVRPPIVHVKVSHSSAPKVTPKPDAKRRPEPARAEAIVQPKPEPVRPTGPVNIFALRDHHCRFPLWHQDDDLDCESRFYCGEAAIGAPYCPAHSAKVAGKRFTPTEGLAYRMAAARAQKARLHTRLKIGVSA